MLSGVFYDIVVTAVLRFILLIAKSLEDDAFLVKFYHFKRSYGGEIHLVVLNEQLFSISK